MPLVYVTGISGSGKSVALQELRRRGYTAYGVDEDGYGRWLDRRTGQERQLPSDTQSAEMHGWFSDHTWVLDVEKIARLKDRVSREGGQVFLCGVAAGDAEAWEYFGVVCALVVDDATIRRRIGVRNDAYGKRPGELAQVLEWNVGYEDTYRRFGAVIIDATQPLSTVVDAIVAAANG